jgi:hypothetical protein
VGQAVFDKKGLVWQCNTDLINNFESSETLKIKQMFPQTWDGWGADGRALCWYGPPPLVPIAPICCVEGLTLADINEFDVEDIRTVLGLLLSCCDCPNGPCGACKQHKLNAFMVQTAAFWADTLQFRRWIKETRCLPTLMMEAARSSETSVSTCSLVDSNLKTYIKK